MITRIPILDVRPQVGAGRWSARAVVGERVPVSATVFREGHDLIGADVVLWAPAKGARPTRSPLRQLDPHSDVWSGEVTPTTTGRWTFAIEAYADPLATWVHRVEVKVGAGQDVTLEMEEGALLLERAAAALGNRGAAARTALTTAAEDLRSGADEPLTRMQRALAGPAGAALRANPLRDLVSTSDKQTIWVDRERALFGSWYELFPRSEGAVVVDGKAVRSGTFATAATRLPAVAAMGFDVVYLPPIHPIGSAFRKGPNNTLEAGPDDPGSPWAIGAAEGGHDAIHPDLGTFADFDAFVATAQSLGMEVALDLALQCSPDHPWVTEHPEWFVHRPDGTIAYAENPPKRYQDIYPLSFDVDPEGLHAEVLRVVRLWVSHGVRIFRVDNPHTKPVAFWERLIAEVKAHDPDVLFLAEAFTRPAMMRTLAMVGFTQSYTYFTWRTAKWELEEYVRELATETADYMRPNFFVNTPDILHASLQTGGPAAFKARAVLASTLSPSWGVYAGYELCEATPVREGSEEYLDSEKYQLRPRDWSEPGLAPYLTRLNESRRRHPALRRLRNVRFHAVDNDSVLAYSKVEGDDRVLVVVNLDPHHVQEATVHLDLDVLDLAPDETFEVRDELADTWYVWHGASNYVRLDPAHEPAHLLSVTPL